MRSEVGADEEGPQRMTDLCEGIVGVRPMRAPIRQEAQLCIEDGKPLVLIRDDVPTPRARWLVGHEIAEFWHRCVDYIGRDIERRADALGAMLVAPILGVAKAAAEWAHEPFPVIIARLAELFRVPQSLALLRLGEVTGRPTRILRPDGPIGRGEVFAWPEGPALWEAVDRGQIKAMRLLGEPDKVGLVRLG